MRLDSRAPLYFMSGQLFGRIFQWLFLSAWLALLFGPGIRDAEPSPGIHWAPLIGIVLRMIPFLAVILAVDWLICWLRARSYQIALVELGIALQSGVLSVRHETLLFSKIQDILIRRTVLERLLGLSSVVIQNAAGQPEWIPGLRREIAEQLREEILRRRPR
jgi:membrane protein YdbS with pleckstrin-like domain